MQKAQPDIRTVAGMNGAEAAATKATPVIYEDGTVSTSVRDSAASDAPTLVGGAAEAEADDDASIKGVASASEGDKTGTQSDLNVNEIPTIKISSESDREREHADLRAAGVEVNGNHAEKEKGAETEEEAAAAKQLEKPVQAAGGDKNDDSVDASNSAQEVFSFTNKRLCERWLDNLFMVLYEVRICLIPSSLHVRLFIATQDLRIWTIFRAEVAHFKTQHVAYRKTGMEWEILGDLGLRLHHKEEAKEAYQRCLDSQRYSYKPWAKLMETYAEEGDLQRTLQTAIRVAAYQHKFVSSAFICALLEFLTYRDYSEYMEASVSMTTMT